MNKTTTDLFSERLKELRKLSKMTQKEVGERIGMTAQGYAAFERGREPSFEKLKQLSELFAVSSDYLIGLSDSWNPSDQSTQDTVNHPGRYLDGGIETIAILQAKLSAEEFSGFCKGNAIKYLSRAGKKTLDPREDYKKARWCLDKLIEVTDELV